MTKPRVDPDLLAAAIDAMQVGLAIIDSDQRIVLMNRAFHESLDLPAGTFPPGIKVIDAVRASALRGAYGPGDPEAQVAVVMAPDRRQAGRLRRRVAGGRSFDLFNAPLSEGAYVVSAIETTSLLAARAAAERAVADTAAAVATLRIGLAAFAADGALVFSNPRFAELLSIPVNRAVSGTGFGALLDAMADRDEYAGADGAAFLAAQRAVDRAKPGSVRRQCGNGLVIDVVSAPLPDGGWTITVSDITPMVRVEDEARRRALQLDRILAAVPHGICVYGADRRVSLFNPTYSQVMGGAALALGEHMEDIIRRRAEAGEYGDGDPAQVYREQMAFDLSRPQQRRRRRPNGTSLDVRTEPMPDGGHISVVTDITAMVEAQATVTRRAAEMTTMLGSIRQGILLWGPDGRMVAANKIASQLLEASPGLLTPGRTDREILEDLRAAGCWGPNEDHDQIVAELAQRDHAQTYVRQFTMRSGLILEMRADPVPGGGWVTTYTVRMSPPPAWPRKPCAGPATWPRRPIAPSHVSSRP